MIRWNVGAATTGYDDFHVKVKLSTGDYRHLGITRSGAVNSLVWAQGASGIAGPFRSGPQFGESYQFLVFGLRDGRPVQIGETAGPVRFMELVVTPTPTPTITPTVTMTPRFTPTPTVTPTPMGLPKVWVTDDEFTTQDLSNSEDRDSDDERKLVIRWSVSNPDYKDFHIKVKESAGGYQHLGHTKSGEVNSFVWSRRAVPGTALAFRSGPQFGGSYQFKIYAITTAGRPVYIGETSGPVQFGEK